MGRAIGGGEWWVVGGVAPGFGKLRIARKWFFAANVNRNLGTAGLFQQADYVLRALVDVGQAVGDGYGFDVYLGLREELGESHQVIDAAVGVDDDGKG